MLCCCLAHSLTALFPYVSTRWHQFQLKIWCKWAAESNGAAPRGLQRGNKCRDRRPKWKKRVDRGSTTDHSKQRVREQVVCVCVCVCELRNFYFYFGPQKRNVPPKVKIKQKFRIWNARGRCQGRGLGIGGSTKEVKWAAWSAEIIAFVWPASIERGPRITAADQRPSSQKVVAGKRGAQAIKNGHSKEQENERESEPEREKGKQQERIRKKRKN